MFFKSIIKFLFKTNCYFKAMNGCHDWVYKNKRKVCRDCNTTQFMLQNPYTNKWGYYEEGEF